MSLIKAGVVGVGKMGEYHVGVLSELPDVELVGITDINAKRAEDIGKKYNVPWFSKPQALFGSIDVAVVAVPTALHYTVAREFLSSGIHVLLEKPCTNNLKDAEKLFEIAAKKKLILHIGHIERFNGAVQELHKIVTAPLFVECKRMSPYSERMRDDGVVLDVMIHDIDIVLNLIQSKVVRTNVVGTSVFSDRDDIVSVQLEFENKCIANLLASRASQSKERTLSVTQKDSFVMLDYTEQEIYVHRQSTSENVMSKGFLRYKQESRVERIFVHKDNPLKLELRHFLDCVSNGSPRKVAVDNEIYSLKIALDIVEQFNKHKASGRKSTKAK